MMLEWDGTLDAIMPVIEKAEVCGKKNVLNIPAAYDSEASSFIDYLDEGKTALLYAWMFGVDDTVIYGRDVRQFGVFITALNETLEAMGKKLIVYVHNLKYDFQFFMRLVEWDNIFNTSRRDILYANMGAVEFRDSLVLSGGLSLAYIGKRLRKEGVNKAVGDLDYNLIRTPETPLSEEELYYCEMDVRVLLQYIREKIEDDGNITKIPYTNTGYVRKYVRDACFQNRSDYLKLMDQLTMTPGCYKMAEEAFAAGAVGPNIRYTGRTFDARKKPEEAIASYDIKSSYPFVMVTRKYPMSYGIPVPNHEIQKYLDDSHFGSIFRLEVFNLLPRADNDYCYPISLSKCYDTIGALVGSGRVISAEYISIPCTNIDFHTWRKFYDFTEYRVSEMRVFHMGYLPDPIVKSVLKFFHDKTTLDGVKGMEVEYQKSKGMLNATFGMSVEKPVREGITYDDGVFTKKPPDYVEAITEYNEKYDRFLFYPWGVFITAYARERLYDAIKEVGSDFVYCDTDSVKFLHHSVHTEWFAKQSKLARLELEKVQQRLKLNKEDVIPCSPDGVEKVLGEWEYEWTADRFKTLGPKRYMLETNGEIKLTVSGTNKVATRDFLVSTGDPFGNFKENLVVPAEYSKRLVATFIPKERYGWVTDYKGVRYFYYSPSGVHMEPVDYHFSVPEYTKRAIAMLLGEEYEEGGPIG